MNEEHQETILILGGDGYLGWSLGLAFANRTNKRVVLADSLIKRKWEKQVNAKLLVPIKRPAVRIAEYKRIFHKDNLSFIGVDLLKQKQVEKLIENVRPDVIINAAQQPSAPFSMMSAKNAAATFSNNLVGHLNLLWSVAQVDKNIRIIKLGSAGCYMSIDTDFLPLGKKDLSFVHRGKEHKILNSFIPMQATDFYHQSKISDFLADDLCAKVWGLKIVTVQQATIFGATIDENHSPEHNGLAARFNYDAVFSTVLNRFACQAAIGHPLTVYGNGEQRTGLISLNACVQNFIKLADIPVTPGKHTVVHNYTHRLSIDEIASKIAETDPSIKINHIKNPRSEPKGKLNRSVEIHKSVREVHNKKDALLAQELARMIEYTKRHSANIDSAIILPNVTWLVNQREKNNRRASFNQAIRDWERIRINGLGLHRHHVLERDLVNSDS